MKVRNADSQRLGILGRPQASPTPELDAAAVRSWRKRLGYLSVFAGAATIVASQAQDASARGIERKVAPSPRLRQAAAPRPGVACDKRIFKSDVHGHVFAIDADSGASCRDFGAAAGHPGYVTHADFDARGRDDNARGSTSGPLVTGDLVVATSGARRYSNSGSVQKIGNR